MLFFFFAMAFLQTILFLCTIPILNWFVWLVFFYDFFSSRHIFFSVNLSFWCCDIHYLDVISSNLEFTGTRAADWFWFFVFFASNVQLFFVWEFGCCCCSLLFFLKEFFSHSYKYIFVISVVTFYLSRINMSIKICAQHSKR